MPRFSIEYANSSEVRIVVESRVTLCFRNIEGRVWKVWSSSYDRKPAVVSRIDFFDARRLAIEEMQRAEHQQHLSDAQIAHIVLANTKKKNLGIETTLDSFMEVAKWCNHSRRPGIMQKIGKIGGNSSTQRAKKRNAAEKKRARTKEEKEKQFELL